MGNVGFLATYNSLAGADRGVEFCNDANAIAAICGQLAGAHYGVEAIPPH